jgi:hypothetical protein
MAVATVAATARRPVGREFGIGPPLENGATWRLPARRVAASSCFTCSAEFMGCTDRSPLTFEYLHGAL